jgi:putative FmdB family regulatory protein
MPLYDYRCEKGHEFEASQSMTDEALDTCEQCGAPAERVFSIPHASVAGASTFTSNYKAMPKSDEDAPPATEEKDDGPSWIETSERRVGPDRTFRRTLRRN